MAPVFFPEYEGKSCHLLNAPFAISEFKLLGFPDSQEMHVFMFTTCFPPISLLLPSTFMDKLLLCNNFPVNHASLFKWECELVPSFFFPLLLAPNWPKSTQAAVVLFPHLQDTYTRNPLAENSWSWLHPVSLSVSWVPSPWTVGQAFQSWGGNNRRMMLT